MIGYKVMRVDEGRLRSGADSRQTFPLERGVVLRMPGQGIFLAPTRQYVLDYYSGLADEEALLTLEFDPDKLLTGNLSDHEPEVSVREATIVDYEVLPRVENPGRTELHIFDFDGTLFRSPTPPVGHEGEWWDDPRSLEPPCVPRCPGPEWYYQDVVAACRAAEEKPEALVVVMTGRPAYMQDRLAEILAHGDIAPDELFLKPDTETRTESYKIFTMRYLARTMPNLRTIEFWEDRHHHLESFERKAHALGYAFVPHPVDAVDVPAKCNPRRTNPSPVTGADLVRRLKF